MRYVIPSILLLALSQSASSANTFLCEEGLELTGSDIFSIENVDSLKSCEEYCSKTDVCQGFVFTDAKECALKDSIGEKSPLKGSTACTRQTDIAADKKVVQKTSSGFECEAGRYHESDLFYIENIASLESCQEHCTAIEECRSLSYKEGQCVLFGKLAVLDESKKSFLSCKKTQVFKCAEGVKFGSDNVLFAVGEVATLEECQNQCVAFTVCAGVNYYKDNSCEILSATTGVEGDSLCTSCAVVINQPVPETKPIAPTPTTAASDNANEKVKFTCKTTLTLPGTDLVSFGNIESLTECQKNCLAVNVCNGFVYKGDECSLKAGGSFVETADKDSQIACLKDDTDFEIKHIPDYTCTETTVVGGDIAVAAHYDEDSCRELCSANDVCDAYVFSSESRSCALKSEESIEAAESSPMSVSGMVCRKSIQKAESKSVPTPSTSSTSPQHFLHEIRHQMEAFDTSESFSFIGNGMGAGKPIKQLTNIQQDHCLAHCQLNSLCEHIVYSSAKSTCDLMDESSAIIQDGESTDQVWSRKPSETISGYQCSNGAYLGGTIATIHNIQSATGCANECSKTSGCVIFVFHSNELRCVLKTLHAQQTTNVIEHSTACLSNDIRKNNEFKCTELIAYAEGSISLINDITSLEGCLTACKGTADCSFAQYMPEKKACELKGDSAVVDSAVEGIVACSREVADRRSVGVLEAAGEEEPPVAFVHVKVSFPIDKLTPAVWSTQAQPDLVTTADATYLSITTAVRVPAGISVLYATTVHHALSTELMRNDNMFMQKLNPTLRHLGLEPITVDNGNNDWGVTADGFEWTQKFKMVQMPVVIPQTSFGTVDERLKLARDLANTVGVSSALVSILTIYQCSNPEATENCEVVWESATPESSAGRRVQQLSTPSGGIKVVTTFDLPDGTTKYEYCMQLVASLQSNTLGINTATDCEQYRDQMMMMMDDSPIDAPADDMTQSVSSRKLMSTTSVSRNVNVLQSDAGSVSGRRRSCYSGWQGSHYGVMSNSFNLDMDPITGTLEECIKTCADTEGCFAFSRLHGADNDNKPLQCWLKKTVLPVVGDQYTHLNNILEGFETYVVSCPPDTDPCRWYHMQNINVAGTESSHVSVQPIVTSSECSSLCELMPDCVAITYRMSDQRCTFIKSLPETLTPEEGYFSSVCYRLSLAKTPCDEGICGVNPENDCFPVLESNTPTHRCICADGFECQGVCDNAVANNCVRSPGSTLEKLFIESLENVLGLDELAYEISAETIPKGASPVPDSTDIVITNARVYVPTTHVVSILFSQTDASAIVENDKVKLNALKSSIIDGLLLLPSKLAVKHLCHVLPSGDVAACWDEDMTEVPVPMRPFVKVSPSENWNAAKSWCGAEGEKMASPKNGNALAQLVEDTYGDMLESRLYWAGARCSEDCSDPAQWSWEDSLETVDWNNLAFGGDMTILNKGHECAVFQWDPEFIRWSLNTADCNYKKAFPVCQETSSPDASRAEECNSQQCDLKVSFTVELQHVRSVPFYSIGNSVPERYYPTITFVPGSKIVDADDLTLGYVDALGKTKAIAYPPVDTVTNPILSKMTGHTFVSEKLRAYLSSQIAEFIDTSLGLTAEYNSMCHVSTEQQHVKCDTSCSLTNPILVQKTSCKGAPPCSADVACSGHGTVKGYVGHCTCTCDAGFTGTDCAQCAIGYAGYPACVEQASDNNGNGEPGTGNDADSPPPSIGADELYEVFHIFFKSGSGRVESSLIDVRGGITSAISDIASERTIRYVCPITACSGSDICKTQTVATWPSAKRFLCTIVDSVPTEDRDVVTLQQIWDIDDAESVLEVSVKYTSTASAAGNAISQQAIEKLLSESLLSTFEIITVISVYGPSTTRDPSEIIDDLLAGNSSVMAPVIIEKEANMTTFYAIAASVAVCLLVIIAVLLFKLYRRRNNYMETDTDTMKSDKATYEEFGTENQEDDDNILIINKDPDERMGILWDDHTLLVDVSHGSAASRYNADRYRDRRVAKVNGVPVSRLSEIRAQVTNQSHVVLEFEPRFVPVTVAVNESPESIDEQQFVKAFAAKVADALDLNNFNASDIDLQSITPSLTSIGQSNVAMNLFGLTSSQVNAVVRLCNDPRSEMCAAPTSIVSAFVEETPTTSKRFNQQNQSTKKPFKVNPLWVCCQWVSGAAEAAGCYVQALGTEIEGLPVWRNKHQPDEHWIFSSKGHWVIVDDAGMSDLSSDVNWVLRSAKPYREDEMPHEVKEWVSASGVVEAEKHIIVSKNEVRAKEFIVGQRVSFPDTVILDDQVKITAKSEGIIMGDDKEDLVKVFLLNEAGDFVVVSQDVLDSPDGPKCLVLHKTAADDLKTWMAATIVKVKGDLVKVSFDCSYCDDLWVDVVKDSDMIKMKQERDFEVNTRVVLDSAYNPNNIDSIQHGEVGTIVAVNKGQAMPYLVQGATDSCWYPGDALVNENATQTSSSGETLPYGIQDDSTIGSFAS